MNIYLKLKKLENTYYLYAKHYLTYAHFKLMSSLEVERNKLTKK